MNSPTISVVIPAYNGAGVISEAVSSVLDQSYRNLELVVVDDGSSDATPEVVGRFKDPRLRFLPLGRNAGADAARQAGLRESAGEVIAFLDQDDAFHPGKLAAHAAYLETHPEIGFTYNPFALVGENVDTLLGVFRPPSDLELEDFIVGFPLPPSVWVLKREWALRGEIWEQSTLALRGRETVFCGRLLLAGCRFGMVDQVLNYRRLGKQRRFKDIEACCGAERRCQELILSDERCPGTARAADTRGLINTCLIWSYYALLQGDSGTGSELIRRAAELDRRVLAGRPSEVARLFLHCCTLDWREDHESSLRRLFAGLPPGWLANPGELSWAVARGYLLRGVRACLWGGCRSLAAYFKRTDTMEHARDPEFAQTVAFELANCEALLGPDVARQRLGELARQLENAGAGGAGRRLRGEYHFNRALRSSANGDRHATLAELLRAVRHAPRFLGNRGAQALLVRSLVGRACRARAN